VKGEDRVSLKKFTKSKNFSACLAQFVRNKLKQKECTGYYGPYSSGFLLRKFIIGP
jgi:hypothetical protein